MITSLAPSEENIELFVAFSAGVLRPDKGRGWAAEEWKTSGGAHGGRW